MGSGEEGPRQVEDGCEFLETECLMALSAASLAKPVESVPLQMDPFIISMKRMIDLGILAHTSADVLKSKVIQQLRIYTGETNLLNEEVSGLFLDLCDLLLSGRLAKISSEVFKTYMVVMTYSCTSEKEKLKDMAALKKMAGIVDDNVLTFALERLKDDGYIDSTEEPVVEKRPDARKTRCNGPEHQVG